jgi:hypothetical protein
MVYSKSADFCQLHSIHPSPVENLVLSAMENSFATSSRADDDSELQDELLSSETEEHATKPPEGPKLSVRLIHCESVDNARSLHTLTHRFQQLATVYPPKPCERCVRMNRTCKGIAGSRCEYCKKLKQKCSNATGPARGRHGEVFLCSWPRRAPKWDRS